MSTLLYNPQGKDKQELINEFVIRNTIFKQIFDDIKSAKMLYPEQHYLLLGQRGSGKTTLITRLKYAIEDDKQLAKKLIPVVFSEEQYNITELANLWEEIAFFLEDYYDFEGLSQEIEKHNTAKDFEAKAFDILIKHLEKHGKKIVLFIDNIGDLLNKFDKLEVHRLREILQTKPHIRLIAGSAVTIESLADYHQPLYEFFKTIQLKGINFDEAVLLLKKLAEIHGQTEKINRIIKETPARIETLRILSGGVPRTIALLFQVLVDYEHNTALNDLERVLDAVTPLYKHRMDDLPTQQQKIVDAVAKNWDAISVKELNVKVRLESKVISAQLNQLEKNQVIEKVTTSTKNHLYLLTERFFNIWYLMRFGRKQDKQRVIWLVKFLEMWCDEKELEQRILSYAEQAKKGTLTQRASEIFGEVYSYFEKIDPETKMVLKEAVPEYVANTINLSDEEFDKLIDKYIANEDWSKLIDCSIKKGNFNDNQKRKIFTLLSSDTTGKFRDKFEGTFKLRKGFKVKDDEFDQIPSFYIFGHIADYSNEIMHILIREDEKLLKQLLDLTVFLYKKLAEFNLVDDYDREKINSIILCLLFFKYYNLALSFYEKSLPKSELETGKYDVMYAVIQYFVQGENNKVLEKYGSEVKETIMKTILKITKTQTKLKKANTTFNNLKKEKLNSL